MRRTARALLTAGPLLCAACEGRDPRVQVEPSAPSASPRTTVAFRSHVLGSFDGGVAWSVHPYREEHVPCAPIDPPAAWEAGWIGTIDLAGTYTAPLAIPPPTRRTVVVRAMSTAHRGLCGEAIVTLVPSPLMPAHGPTLGGTLVRFEIDGLDELPTVRFGGIESAVVEMEGPGRCTAVTPPPPASLLHDVGPVDVEVSSAGRAWLFPGGFRYRATSVEFVGGRRISPCLDPGMAEAVDLVGGPDADLAVVCRGEGAIVVFSVGTGSVAAFSHGGADPSSWAFGRFDGDARTDVVLAGTNNLRVFLQTSPGGFEGTAPLPGLVPPLAGVATADHDGDGVPDLLVLESQPTCDAAFDPARNRLRVFLGDGAGGFAEIAEFPVGECPVAVVAGGLDGDPLPDYAVSFRGDESAASPEGGVTLIRSAAPSYALASPIAEPFELTLADLDADSFPELVLGHRGGPGLLFVGTSGGPTAVTTQLDVGAQPSGRVRIAALGSSGSLAVVLPATEGMPVTTLAWRGTTPLGTPGDFETEALRTLGVGASALVLDANGDGWPDLLHSENGGAVVSVDAGTGRSLGPPLTQTPTGVADLALVDGLLAVLLPAPAESLLVLDLSGGQQVVAIGDPGAPSFLRLESAGGSDLLVIDTGSDPDIEPGRAVLLSRQPPAWLASAVVEFPGSLLNDAAAADLDGDGNLDIVGITFAPATGLMVAVAWGTALGFAAPMLVPAPEGSPWAPFAVAAADLDVDGLADLAVANLATGELAIAPGTADRTLSFRSFVSAFPGVPPRELSAADADGDGLVDLVLLVQRNDEGVAHAEVVTLLNRGGSGSTLTFDERSHAFVGTPSDLALGDADGDGVLDVAVGLATPPSVALLLGTGDGGLGDPFRLPAGGLPGAVALGAFPSGLPALAVSDAERSGFRILPNISH